MPMAPRAAVPPPPPPAGSPEEAASRGAGREVEVPAGVTVGVMRGHGTAITDADDAFLAMVGWTRDDFARGLMDWAEMTPPEYLVRDEAGMRQAAETGGFTVPYQKEFVRRDGSRVPVLLACAFVPNGDGAWIGYVVDLTATRARQAAPLDADVPLTGPYCAQALLERLIAELVRERGRMVGMLDGADALIWAVDRELRLLSANAAFQAAQRAISGQDLAIGDPVIGDAFPEAVRSEWRAAYRRALGGGRDTLHTSAAYPDGTRHFESRLSPMLDVDGSVLGVTVVSRDVTARRRDAEALRVSEERYALAARATRNAIWDWDLTTGRVIWSEGLATIFGHVTDGPVEAVTWWSTHVHPDDVDRVVDGMRAVLASADGTTAWEDTYRFRRADGRWAEVLDRGYLSREPDADGRPGRVVRMIGAMEDVTPQRALEARLRQAQKMEALGQLAGGIAHDFNNLLTVIGGSLEFACGALAADHAARPDLDEIAAAAERARTLVRQLLAFSRQQVVRPRVVQVGDVVRGMERLLRRVLGEELALEVLVDEGTPPVRIDPGQLEQVVMNLVVNARDALLTPRHGHPGTGGSLGVEVGPRTLDRRETAAWGGLPPGTYVEVVVRDTGHGMDEETRTRLFEPFFTTKEVGAGTGLGLATVHGIVQQAGGAIRVESVPGQGSTFTILLPGAAEGEAAPLAPPPPAVRAGTAAAARVLLVEDEAPVRAIVRRSLERRGYTVLEARHGADALLLWERHGPAVDVVVTDVRMPEVGGRDLVARLREARPDLPVVYVSGYADEAVALHLDAHDRFIAKPFAVDALLGALQELLTTPSR